MIKEANRPRPKGTSSKTLKECLEKNYSKIVSEDLYVEIQYFQRGKDALEWKRRRILAERGVTEGIIVTPIPEVALSSTEWTCRWLDGTITVAIVEDNLKNFTQEDKKPIEGLSFHVLGHIEDMNQKDYFTSFPEFLEMRTSEEMAIAEKASTLRLEYTAEKIAIEKGIPSLLAEFRKRVGIVELQRQPKELKRISEQLKRIKNFRTPSRKEFLILVNIPIFAYKIAWMESDYKDLYLQELKPLEEQFTKIYSEMKVKVFQTLLRYGQELEEQLANKDLSDFEIVKALFERFIS